MAGTGAGFAFCKPGDITIRKFLGGGGFGGVSLASHEDWGDVAVKEFNKITVNDEILKEAKKMWGVVSCPYLVSIMGVIEDPGKPLSIVMEYLQYGDLMKFNRKYMMGCNCWARKIKMIQEISLGMNFLHTQNPPVIHRDLKLENVFVGSGFSVKIGDLGLALSTKTVQDMYNVSVAGTFSHIPPEGWSNTTQKPDKFWDIFTFAITSFELLSGKDPWLEHADAVMVFVWLQTGKRPDLEQIPADAPSEITALMEKCWNGTPSQRPTFQEIKKTVSQVYRSQFEASIVKADTNIFKRIEVVSDELAQEKTDSSTADSGWGSFGTTNVKDNATKDDPSNVVNKAATSKDSGIGIAGGTPRPSNAKGTNKPPPPVSPKKQADLSRAPSPPKAAGIGKTPDSQQKPTYAHNMREWRLVKEFGVEGDGEGEFRRAEGIAVCQNDDIAVAEKEHEKVYLFAKDSAYKSTLKSHATDPTGKLIYPTAVAVTSQGHLIVADQKKYVKLFEVTGSFLHSICTLTPDEDPNTKVCTYSVAVSPDDDIIVGDIARRLVTIHTQADGWAPRKVKLPITPSFLATNSQRHLLVSSWNERKVIALSMDGDVLFSLDGFCVDGKAGQPKGLVCDSNDDIYIGVMKVNESNLVILGTGHIHQYDNTGIFLRCIAKGLYRPCGMTMHNGSLYVANKKSVLIYST